MVQKTAKVKEKARSHLRHLVNVTRPDKSSHPTIITVAIRISDIQISTVLFSYPKVGFLFLFLS